MSVYEYYLLDVFTQRALEGNQLAVFPDARGLDTDTMRRIARETNLSETTFVFPPERNGVPRVRVFTPGAELDFAGHPTLGTAYVLRELEIVPRNAERFALHENVGDVPVRVEGGERPMFWLTMPAAPDRGTLGDADAAAALGVSEEALAGVPVDVFESGNPYAYVVLRTPDDVDRAVVNTAALRQLFEPLGRTGCVFVYAKAEEGAYSRMFAPEIGIVEDPATGSATGPLALHMMRHGLMPKADGTRVVSVQGAKMGRRSELHVAIYGEGGSERIEVGGYVTPVGSGRLDLRYL